jgi:Mat/Ecp fimbriae major subunit
MKKVLIIAGAVSALAFTSAPAYAVSPTTQATANARIVKPLTLTAAQNLDLGTIVLSGTAPYTQTVGITQAGVFSCGGASLTCSGTTQTAQYTATGTQGQTLTVAGSPTIALANSTQPTAPNIPLTVAYPAAGSVVLNSAGTVTFDIGGSIQVSDTTPDGVYGGTFDVTADYQ